MDVAIIETTSLGDRSYLVSHEGVAVVVVIRAIAGGGLRNARMMGFRISRDIDSASIRISF